MAKKRVVEVIDLARLPKKPLPSGINFKCTACGHEMTRLPKYAGMLTTCTECGEYLRIPLRKIVEDHEI